VTSEDHNTDAIVSALRSPALPSEQVGEAAAMTAMLGVLQAGSAGAVGFRSRRGIAIAAVTVASLGVGGLVAAGPGFFTEANDPPAAVSAPTSDPDAGSAAGTTLFDEETTETTVPDETVPSTTVTGDSLAANIIPEVECEEGNHGATVSKVARAAESLPGKGAIVSQAAKSDCGKDGEDGEESAGGVECADGNHGKTVSSIAQETESGPGKGAIVSEVAKGDCGKDRTEEPARKDDASEPKANSGNSGAGNSNSGSGGSRGSHSDK
jgi:hypothetical protein